MKVQEVIVSESGNILVNKDAGFIVIGAVLKADFASGLYGSGNIVDTLAQLQVEPKAYTTEEFLDGLYIPLEQLKLYVAKKIEQPRHQPRVL